MWTSQRKQDPDGDQKRAYQRERRRMLIERGICLWCGKAKAVEGQTLCAKCKVKNNETQQVYNIKRRMKAAEEKERIKGV